MPRKTRRKTGATLSMMIAEYERAHEGKQRRLHGYDRAHLERALGSLQLADISEKRITDYGLDREKGGASTPIINDELRALGWVFDWARETGRIGAIPRIWFMRETQSPIGPSLSTHPILGGFSPFSRGLLAAADVPRRERAKRGKLSREAFTQHLAEYPLEMGLSVPKRVKILAETGISVDRTTVQHRISEVKRKRTQ
jgi:hypothetical protein